MPLAREGLSRTESRPEENSVEVPFGAHLLNKRCFCRQMRNFTVIRIGYVSIRNERAYFLYANKGGNADSSLGHSSLYKG